MFISKRRVLRINKRYILIGNIRSKWENRKMSETNVIAKNADAEKLLNYLIAYKRHLNGEQPEGDSVTIDAIPLEENVTIPI